MGAIDRPAWHAGELAVQERVGVAERMASVGPCVLRPYLLDQHREFYPRLSFIVAGAVDADGFPLASLLTGAPGFVTSPNPTTLRIDALPDPADPLDAALRPGAALGLLGIELPTKRRNRANGTLAARDANGFALSVEQSFGNCPQYITAREITARESGPTSSRPLRIEPLEVLDAKARALLARADTIFVASAAAGGADVSHRGGPPGFLTRDEAGALLLPDYRGNSYFNTLGNLALNPLIGLAIPDFASGDLLRIRGRAEIQWGGNGDGGQPGTERLVRIAPERALWLRGGAPIAKV